MRTGSFLEKIGFTADESSIYHSLLARGPSSISDIVRSTGIHRPAVYRILPSLIGKNLVSMMPKGKYKTYIAESPDRLIKLFRDLEDDFDDGIKEFHDIYASQKKKPIVTFGEGKDSIAAAYSDMIHSLKKGDIYYRYASTDALNRERFLPRDYRVIRDKKQLERLVITNDSTRKLHSQKLGRSVKTIPRDFDLFEYNIAQIIYGSKIAFIDYNSKTVVTIENDTIALFQKKIFKLLFSKL